jgi:hypothetical protein
MAAYEQLVRRVGIGDSLFDELFDSLIGLGDKLTEFSKRFLLCRLTSTEFFLEFSSAGAE